MLKTTIEIDGFQPEIKKEMKERKKTMIFKTKKEFIDEMLK